MRKVHQNEVQAVLWKSVYDSKSRTVLYDMSRVVINEPYNVIVRQDVMHLYRSVHFSAYDKRNLIYFLLKLQNLYMKNKSRFFFFSLKDKNLTFISKFRVSGDVLLLV